MSVELHEAIQQAQAGNRKKARQLLWQVLKGEPNNTVAWLWLGSVAKDRAEYERAVNEVLRIDPANEHALQMRAQLQQQDHQPPPTASRARRQPRLRLPSLPPLPRPRAGGHMLRRVLTVAVSALAIALLAVLVIWALVALLGGNDDPGGRDVSLRIEDYKLAVTLPDGWYAALEADEGWQKRLDDLNDDVPFADPARDWSFDTLSLDHALIAYDTITFFETRTGRVREAGYPLAAQFDGIHDTLDLEAYLRALGSPAPRMMPSFTCENVAAWVTEFELNRPRDVENIEPFEHGEGLCGVRWDAVVSTGNADRAEDDRLMILADIPVPDALRVVTFLVPFTKYEFSSWEVVLPEAQFADYDDALARLGRSVRVTRLPGTSAVEDTSTPVVSAAKDLAFTLDEHSVALRVPRTWFAALAGSQAWDTKNSLLSRKLNVDTRTFTRDAEGLAIEYQSLASPRVFILETSLPALRDGGYLSSIDFLGLVQPGEVAYQSFRPALANFTCDTVNPAITTLDDENAQAFQPQDGDEDLCGVMFERVDLAAVPFDRRVEGFGVLGALHTLYFVTPLDETTGAAWIVTVPEHQYAAYEPHIEQMIGTAQVMPLTPAEESEPDVAPSPAPPTDAPPTAESTAAEDDDVRPVDE